MSGIYRINALAALLVLSVCLSGSIGQPNEIFIVTDEGVQPLSENPATQLLLRFRSASDFRTLFEEKSKIVEREEKKVCVLISPLSLKEVEISLSQPTPLEDVLLKSGIGFYDSFVRRGVPPVLLVTKQFVSRSSEAIRAEGEALSSRKLLVQPGDIIISEVKID